MDCIYCDGHIRWDENARRWFHLNNLMTFCLGTGLEFTVATPKRLAPKPLTFSPLQPSLPLSTTPPVKSFAASLSSAPTSKRF
jgi:hypothetical protein